MRSGKPIQAFFWFAAILNPRSAAIGASDAEPRLLAVAPIFTPPKGPGSTDSPVTVWTDIKLDSTGAPQSITIINRENDKFRPAIDSGIKAWRFAPGRLAGRAVASEAHLPVLRMPGLCRYPTPNLIFRRG
jgi:hypothetical protein